MIYIGYGSCAGIPHTWTEESPRATLYTLKYIAVISLCVLLDGITVSDICGATRKPTKETARLRRNLGRRRAVAPVASLIVCDREDRDRIRSDPTANLLICTLGYR